MSKPLTTAQAKRALERAEAKYEAALEAFNAAGEAYLTAETRELSLRYPQRVVSAVSGNGIRRIEISRRRPLKYGDWGDRKVFNATYPDRFRVWPLGPCESLVQLDQIEDLCRLPGFGSGGCVSFKNGVEQ